MKKSVSLNGLSVEALARRKRAAFSAQNLLRTLRQMGLSDEEIRAALLKYQAATKEQNNAH